MKIIRGIILCIFVGYLVSWGVIRKHQFWYRQPVPHYYQFGWGTLNPYQTRERRTLDSVDKPGLSIQCLQEVGNVTPWWEKITNFLRNHFRNGQEYRDNYQISQVQWWCGWREGEWYREEGWTPQTYLLLSEGQGQDHQIVGMIHGQPVRLAAKNGQWGYFVDLLSVHQEYRGLGLAPVLISKMADYRGIPEGGGGESVGEEGGGEDGRGGESVGEDGRGGGIGGRQGLVFLFKIEGGCLPYIPASILRTRVGRLLMVGDDEGGERGKGGEGLGGVEGWKKLSWGRDREFIIDQYLSSRDEQIVLGREGIEFYFNHPGVEGWGYHKDGARVSVWFRSYPVLEQGDEKWMVEIWGVWGDWQKLSGQEWKDWWRGVRNNTRDSSNSKGREWIIWQNHGRRMSSLERGVGGEWRDGPTVCYHFYNTPYRFPKINGGWKCLL